MWLKACSAIEKYTWYIDLPTILLKTPRKWGYKLIVLECLSHLFILLLLLTVNVANHKTKAPLYVLIQSTGLSSFSLIYIEGIFSQRVLNLAYSVRKQADFMKVKTSQELWVSSKKKLTHVVYSVREQANSMKIKTPQELWVSPVRPKKKLTPVLYSAENKPILWRSRHLRNYGWVLKKSLHMLLIQSGNKLILWRSRRLRNYRAFYNKAYTSSLLSQKTSLLMKVNARCLKNYGWVLK